jgi:hypothetical protein
VTPRVVASIGVAVARHPSVWAVAVRQWWRTTPNGWWRHAPFLPLPSGDYVRFRLVTQYGSETHRIDPADVLNYLVWCKRQEHIG